MNIISLFPCNIETNEATNNIISLVPVSRHVPKGGGARAPQILADHKAPPAAAARRITACPPRFLDFGTCLVGILNEFNKMAFVALDDFLKQKLAFVDKN